MDAQRRAFQACALMTGTIQQSADDRLELHFETSHERISAAKKLSPGGVHSNVRLNEVPWPLSFQSADGVHLTDVDGNLLLDFALGQGPLLLGHRPPEVIQAVERQLK